MKKKIDYKRAFNKVVEYIEKRCDECYADMQAGNLDAYEKEYLLGVAFGYEDIGEFMAKEVDEDWRP